MDYYLVICAAIVFIERRLSSGIRYDELAKSVGFSVPHLRAVFLRHMGQPLAHYIMSRRIARAAFDAVHGEESLLAIAERYGFSNPDTFTRAFRRVTGENPVDFRRKKHPVGNVKLCMGVFGVSILKKEGLITVQNGHKHTSDGSVVLYGVPKAHYGAFEGCTPYPICLKVVANYMGVALDYDEAIVNCGAAFRLVWDTTCWNGGNVDVLLAFDDPSEVFRSGVSAMGRAFRLLGRDGAAVAAEPDKFTMADNDANKEAFIAFIKEHIDKGVPVIALGIIGPPEACVVTGYRDDGRTLLGWNMFQDNPEFSGGASIDESGYFVTSNWWENRDTVAVMAVGEPVSEPEPLRVIINRGIAALTGRQHGQYAKGIAAYDAWKKALLDESQFSEDLIIPLQFERLMCQGDGMDCLADGRTNACRYFKKKAEENPGQSLLARLAEQFNRCANGAHRMYEIMGGWERGEAQLKALMQTETRSKLGAMIDECKAADEQALSLMKELADRL